MKRPGLPPLAVALAAARRQLNLTQGELAERLDLSKRSISRWESGHWSPMRMNHAAILETFAGLPAPMLRELTTLLVGVDPGGPSPAPLPAVDARGTIELLVFRAAEELDLGPRRVRGAIARVLEGIERAGVSLRESREALGSASPVSSKSGVDDGAKGTR